MTSGGLPQSSSVTLFRKRSPIFPSNVGCHFCLEFNSVREVIELCQFYGWDLKFQRTKTGGNCLIKAQVNGGDVSATASTINRNSKTAKQMAAEQTLTLLRAKGYKLKIKPLEEVLKSGEKMEPKLIGYNEVPCLVSANFNDLTLQQQTCVSNDAFNIRPLSEILSRKLHTKAKRTRNTQGHSQEANDCSPDSPSATAKSRLYEICAVNCWKPPAFECCDEAGPSHLKEFRFKVTVEMEERSSVLVAFREPRLRKKDAAEHAAEGALWYLKNIRKRCKKETGSELWNSWMSFVIRCKIILLRRSIQAQKCGSK